MTVPVEKANWIHWAEIFDAWRIVPRLVLLSYGWFVYHVVMYILAWYTHLTTTSSVGDGVVVSVCVTAVTGFAPWVLKIYMDASTDWKNVPPPGATPPTVTATQVTVSSTP